MIPNFLLIISDQNGSRPSGPRNTLGQPTRSSTSVQRSTPSGPASKSPKIIVTNNQTGEPISIRNNQLQLDPPSSSTPSQIIHDSIMKNQVPFPSTLQDQRSPTTSPPSSLNPSDWTTDDVIKHISSVDSSLDVHAEMFRKHVNKFIIQLQFHSKSRFKSQIIIWDFQTHTNSMRLCYISFIFSNL